MDVSAGWRWERGGGGSGVEVGAGGRREWDGGGSAVGRARTSLTCTCAGVWQAIQTFGFGLKNDVKPVKYPD